MSHRSCRSVRLFSFRWICFWRTLTLAFVLTPMFVVVRCDADAGVHVQCTGTDNRHPERPQNRWGGCWDGPWVTCRGPGSVSITVLALQTGGSRLMHSIRHKLGHSVTMVKHNLQLATILTRCSGHSVAFAHQCGLQTSFLGHPWLLRSRRHPNNSQSPSQTSCQTSPSPLSLSAFPTTFYSIA